MKYPRAARILIRFYRVFVSSRACCERLPLNTGCFLIAAFHLDICMLHQHGFMARCSGAKGFGEENLHHLA